MTLSFPTYEICSLDIQEAFSSGEGLGLRKLAQEVARKDAIFVEIGSWKGFSSSFLGQVAKECGGDLYCIDHWKGSEEVVEHKEIKNCLEIFRHNIKALELEEYVHPVVMNSITASKIFADGIADLVFIDADHRYKAIKQDLEVWYPKVKVGGIICGHDCDAYYSTYYDKTFVDVFKDTDCIWGKDNKIVHPGIMKALYEYFSDKHLVIEDTSIWFIEKEGNG